MCMDAGLPGSSLGTQPAGKQYVWCACLVLSLSQHTCQRGSLTSALYHFE